MSVVSVPLTIEKNGSKRKYAKEYLSKKIPNNWVNSVSVRF